MVSILEDKKTELRSLRLAKPQRAKLSSVQERKFEEYKAEYTKTEEIIRSCNDEIVKVRKRFDLQNLKLDYEKDIPLNLEKYPFSYYLIKTIRDNFYQDQ